MDQDMYQTEKSIREFKQIKPVEITKSIIETARTTSPNKLEKMLLDNI